MRFGKMGHVARFLLIAGLLFTVIGLVLCLGAYPAVPAVLLMLCLIGFALAVLPATAARTGQAVPATARSRSPPQA